MSQRLSVCLHSLTDGESPAPGSSSPRHRGARTRGGPHAPGWVPRCQASARVDKVSLTDELGCIAGIRKRLRFLFASYTLTATSRPKREERREESGVQIRGVSFVLKKRYHSRATVTAVSECRWCGRKTVPRLESQCVGLEKCGYCSGQLAGERLVRILGKNGTCPPHG